MTHLVRTIAVDAAPEAVWEVLGDLAATTEWIPGTVAARMEGTIRICSTADGAEIREEISNYSSELRTYRFRHRQVPLPVESSGGTFTVHAAADQGAVVVLECDFDAREPAQESQIAAMLGEALDGTLVSLRRRVERGLTWQAA